MYPNLYYVFKDLFGVEWKPLSFLNTFGLMVAVAFIVAAIVLSSELKRKEKLGLLFPREEYITVGKPASFIDLLLNFLTGFIFGYKLIGLFFSKPDDISPQNYIFSSEGNIAAGLLLGFVLAGLKWWEKRKQQLKEPEQRVLRIWPHDRVGDIVVIALVSGIIGAKLFDNFENWDDFIQHPFERMFSAGGLTFYGGLITAAVSLGIYSWKKNMRLIYLADAMALSVLIAYGVGRIGCQVSGDGDWGVYNSAYITDLNNGKAVLAKPGEYEARLNTYSAYFLDGERKSTSLADVPHRHVVAPFFLPVWIVAYSYPQNVNKDGVKIASLPDEHDKGLPVPVLPTPLYETVAITFLFLILWSVRKRIKTPGMIMGLYLLVNGIERFTIEKIRVNNHILLFGFRVSQAEIISFCLMVAGLGIIIYLSVTRRNYANGNNIKRVS